MWVPGCGWISTLQSILRSSSVTNLFFLKRNFSLPFILFTTFNAIGSLDIDSSNTHPRYVTSAFCFIFISLYLIFSLQIFLVLRLLAKRIDLVLSSPKWILNLLSTNQSQIFSKSSLSIFFDYCNTFILVHKTWVTSIQEQIWFYFLRHVIDINQKQKRSQDGTLRNSTRNLSKFS